MTFLRNAWYCAGFSSDLEPGKTRAITMLGEPVVLYRKEDGAPVALADRCPHRFAPLSSGRVCEGQLQCGYHGLRFDASGQCTHNPHGDGAILGSPSIQVKAGRPHGGTARSPSPVRE